MAVQSQLYVVGASKTYISTKPIANKQHMAVFGLTLGTGLYEEIQYANYDLINQAAVFNEDFNLQGMYSQIEVRVADTPDELGASTPAIGIVAENIADVIIVADDIDHVIIAADNMQHIVDATTAPLSTAIIAVTADPLMTDILNAEENANDALSARAGAETAREAAETARDYSHEWATNPVDEPVDDQVNPIGRSSFGWALMSRLASEGLKLEGEWNPNSGLDPVPADGVLDDGDFWFVTENSNAPVYGETWTVGDRIVYWTLQTPDPWLKYPNYISWDDIIGKPQNVYNQETDVVTGALETHFDISFLEGTLNVSHNGLILVPNVDYVIDTPDPITHLSYGFKLINTPTAGDEIVSTGIYSATPPALDMENYWKTNSSVLTAKSYATQPYGEEVIIFTSNGDGTYTETPQTDVFSSLSWEKQTSLTGDTQVTRVEDEGDTQVARVIVYADEAEDYNGEAEASALTADAFANTPEFQPVPIYTWDSVNNVMNPPDTSADYRSSLHWMEQAKLVASGLTFDGTWSMDAACTMPPDSTVDGSFYIVTLVDPACTTYAIGDWLIWSGSSYHQVAWTFSWTIAEDVTVDGAPPAVGDDLARRSTSVKKAGDTMTGRLVAEGSITTKADEILWLSDATTTASMGIRQVAFNGHFEILHRPDSATSPTTMMYFDTAGQAHLTEATGDTYSAVVRKDYADALADSLTTTSGGDMTTGRWTKMADGTLLMYGRMTSGNITIGEDSITMTVTYPIVPVEQGIFTPIQESYAAGMQPTLKDTDGAIDFGAADYDFTATTEDGTFTMGWSFIGRWKQHENSN